MKFKVKVTSRVELLGQTKVSYLRELKAQNMAKGIAVAQHWLTFARQFESITTCNTVLQDTHLANLPCAAKNALTGANIRKNRPTFQPASTVESKPAS